MLPAWVSEPPPTERYAHHEGQDREDRPSRDRRPRDKRRPDRKGPKPSFDRPFGRGKPGERPRQPDRRPPRGRDRLRKDRHRPPVERPLPPIAVKFLPRITAFENVVEQIKSGSVAYSLFALASFSGKSHSPRCSIDCAAQNFPLSAWRKRRCLGRSTISRAKRVSIRPRRLLQDRHHRERTDQRKFHKCCAL